MERKWLETFLGLLQNYKGAESDFFYLFPHFKKKFNLLCSTHLYTQALTL